MKLRRRNLSVGPYEHAEYTLLCRIAKGNGFECPEDFITDMIVQILTDDEAIYAWVVATMDHDHLAFARRVWGKDASPNIDETLYNAMETLAGKTTPPA